MGFFPILHPAFKHAPSLKEQCHPFFSHYNLVLFSFIRYYEDHSISCLSTCPDFHRHWLTEYPFISGFNQRHLSLNKFPILWDENLPPELCIMAREKFNFYQGLTLIRRYKNFYDLVFLAFNHNQPCPGSVYLRHINEFECFSNYLLKKNASRFQEVDKLRIFLPEERWDREMDNMLLTKKTLRYPLMGIKKKSYITSTELICIQLSYEGYSRKEISKILNISPHTIETYIKRIRERTGKRSIRDIFALFVMDGFYT